MASLSSSVSLSTDDGPHVRMHACGLPSQVYEQLAANRILFSMINLHVFSP